MSRIDEVWRYDEFRQVGKDYAKVEEVEQYEARHADFRDIKAESNAVLDMLGVGEGHVLADVGCGTGIFAMEAARRCARVHACDVSKAMLDYLRKKGSEAGVGNIEFHHQGFLTLELPAESLDFLTTTLALHHLPDFWKSVALARMHAALKPGATLYIHDVVLEQENAADNVQALIESLGQAGGNEMRKDAEAHFREEFSTFDWIMDGLLERAGFRIDSKTIKDGVFVTYRCVKA